jgi:hypothetical protein
LGGLRAAQTFPASYGEITMPTYQPTPHFQVLADSETGKTILNYLTERDTIREMSFAISLGHSPVEGLSFLRAKVGDAAFEKPYRRLIGHMIRQIMEAEGFQYIGSQFRTKTDCGFVTGAKYRAPGEQHWRPLKVENPAEVSREERADRLLEAIAAIKRALMTVEDAYKVCR